MKILSFKIDIYREKSTDCDPIESHSGQLQEWERYRQLKVRDGFDGAVTLHLGDCWNTILNNKLSSYTQTVTAKETIIKFGDTMQLTHNFTVVVNTVFQSL